MCRGCPWIVDLIEKNVLMRVHRASLNRSHLGPIKKLYDGAINMASFVMMDNVLLSNPGSLSGIWVLQRNLPRGKTKQNL